MFQCLVVDAAHPFEETDRKTITTSVIANDNVNENQSLKCVPLTMFGQMTEYVPEKLSEMASMMATMLHTDSWPNQLTSILAKKLMVVNDMVATLDRNRNSLELADIVMAFRWFFHINFCMDNGMLIFSERVLKYAATIEECTYNSINFD